MKALFVSRDYEAMSNDGGGIVTKRNVEFLRQICTSVDELIKPKAALVTLAKNMILRQSYGATNNLIRRFKTLISENKYDFIWFDGSCDCSFIKLANEKNIPSICFYHNVELSFYKAKALASGSLLDKFFVPYIHYAEKYVTRNATHRVLLNERDSNELGKLYGTDGDLIMPTSFNSINADYLEKLANDKIEPYLMFVGSNFWANKEGLEWFFKNVAPYIQNKIKIIGGICNAFKDVHLPKNVELLGYVDNLDPYYANASAIISPILSGSGTKTKTIEALRYGKTIIGSKEALMGVPPEYYSKIGYLCDTPDCYIDAIGQLDDTKINCHSLAVFDKLFSSETVIQNLQKFIQSKFND